MKKHKTGIIFALTMVACAVAGAFLGVAAINGRDALLSVGVWINDFLRRNAVWAMGLVLLIEVSFGLQLRLAARRAVARALAAPEDDALLDAADDLCDWGVGLMSVCNILGFLCMGLGFAGAMENGSLRLLLLLVLFVVGMVVATWMTNFFVVLTGELYPEKKASILSMKFHKEWFACCDEAERHQIGQASYASMRTGQTACTYTLAALMLLAMFFNIGIAGILAVALIWLVMTVSYLRACHRCRRARLSKKDF